MQPTNLAELLEELVREYGHASQLHALQLQTDSRDLVAMSDRPRLYRALANVLTNAIKYSPQGGEITLALTASAAPTGQNSATIRMIDHGLGIPASELPHIFDRYFRANNVRHQISGTGIGLAGVKQVIEQLGGSITVEPRDGWDDEDVGELVYRGPNVMMGYAHRRADLALGKTVDALHTGDIARRGSDGLYEVIGRSSRFVKMYGLRIDLQHVEAIMRDHGVTAFCTDADDRLAVAAACHDQGEVQRVAAAVAGVPIGAVRAVAVSELPMLPSGKPDYHAVRSLAPKDATPNVIGLRELFADVLQIDADSIDPDASFVDLGGNSLSYVTMSVRLERALGRLPADWQRLPLRELEAMPKAERRWWPCCGGYLSGGWQAPSGST